MHVYIFLQDFSIRHDLSQIIRVFYQMDSLKSKHSEIQVIIT